MEGHRGGIGESDIEGRHDLEIYVEDIRDGGVSGMEKGDHRKQGQEEDDNEQGVEGSEGAGNEG